jgi:hypothetical protein
MFSFQISQNPSNVTGDYRKILVVILNWIRRRAGKVLKGIQQGPVEDIDTSTR